MGFYSNGCILDSSALPQSGPGFVSILRERKHHYGNEELVSLLRELGSAYSERFPAPNERIQIADLSSKRGGPQGSQHASHQTGLDVDVLYLRHDHREADSMDESFVDKKGNLKPNFDIERNWWALRYLALSGNVSRIFVNAAIKNYYCEHAQEFDADASARYDVLRILQPWAGHDDHFHMRLACPKDDANCINQTPIPGGDGCAEASRMKPEFLKKAPQKKRAKKKTPRKRLPALCLKR